MKAIYGPVVNIRPIPSRSVTRIEIDVPIERHVEVTDMAFGQNVLVTLAPPMLGDTPFGVIEPKANEFDDAVEEQPISQIATFSVNEAEAQDVGGSTWVNLGSLCQSAIMLCKDERFQKWAISQKPADQGTWTDEEYAATYIRERCGVTSRKQLDETPEARKKFQDMMLGYRTWINAAT